MQSIQHTIPGALREIMRRAPLSADKVSCAWRVVVGASVERATRVRFSDGVLHVDAADTVWATEVRRASAMILNRLAALLGPDAVRRIEVRARK